MKRLAYVMLFLFVLLVGSGCTRDEHCSSCDDWGPADGSPADSGADAQNDSSATNK